MATSDEPRDDLAPEPTEAPAPNLGVVAAPEPVDAAQTASTTVISSRFRAWCGGVLNSVASARTSVMNEDKRRARNLGAFVTAALLVGGLLGGTAGGAFAIWNLSSR